MVTDAYLFVKNEFKIKIIGTLEIITFIRDYVNSLGININQLYKRQEHQEVVSIDFGGNIQVLTFFE